MKKPPEVKMTLEYVYKHYFGSLLLLANKHIVNRDYAIDAVHNAFIKAQKYAVKRPDRGINVPILRYEVARACRRINKKTTEVPYGLMPFSATF